MIVATPRLDALIMDGSGELTWLDFASRETCVMPAVLPGHGVTRWDMGSHGERMLWRNRKPIAECGECGADFASRAEELHHYIILDRVNDRKLLDLGHWGPTFLGLRDFYLDSAVCRVYLRRMWGEIYNGIA